MEYARDVGVLARSRGLFNIFVSNGYDTPETVGMMREFLDCVTVDFKGSGETSFVEKVHRASRTQTRSSRVCSRSRRGPTCTSR